VRSTRRLLGLVATAAALGGALVAPATPAFAIPATPSSSITARAADGSPPTDVTVGDSVDVAAVAPITRYGQTRQTIETSWSPAAARFTAGSVTAPEGWPVEYTADGETWDTSVPAGTVTGVRTSGDVQSKGYTNGAQTSTTTATGQLRTAPTFQGASGGDGWDVFLAGDKVLNVWHHNPSTYNLDCHLRTDGSSCDTSVYSLPGYTTSSASGGSVVDNKVYSIVGQTSSNSFGALCTDVSTTPFTSCGYHPLRTGSSFYDELGSQSIVGDRVYTPLGTGELLCFDVSDNAACGGQPYVLPDFGSAGVVPAFATAVDTKLFVTATSVYCFDGATGNPCAGTWPAGSLTGQVTSVAPARATDGTLTGVCSLMPATACLDLSGASVPYPAGLAALLAAKAPGQMAGYADWAFTGTRQYWAANDAYWNGVPVCYDWTTDTACAGFTPAPGGIGTARYAIRTDPTSPDCLWSNGDDGKITSFNGRTGAVGCSFGDPVLVLPYTVFVPRMGCLETGRVRAWEDLTFTTPGNVDVTDLRVTVKKADGSTVAGWTAITPTVGGTLDLTTLDAAETGTKPSFEVTALGVAEDDAATITGALTYSSDAPELCVRLAVVQNCPTLTPGISADPTVPVAPLTVSGRTVSTVGSTDVATPLSIDVSRGAMSGCLAGVDGTVVRSYPGGTTPLGSTEVHLLGPTGAVVAEGTTDLAGRYAFDNVHPGAYKVAVGAHRENVTLAATDAKTVAVAIPVTAPAARPVTGTTLQHTAATFPVDVTTDPVTGVDAESVVLFDPEAEAWVTTVAVSGEGTWTVTAEGSLRFTPVVAFTGTATAIGYRVADGYGTTASSTATVTVSSVPPTAAPVTGSGVQGQALTITPAGTSPAVPLDPAATRLVDSAGTPVRTLTVEGVGEYVVDADGAVLFTPAGTFSGSHTVIYRVVDQLGRAATSTITVTVAAITPVAPPAKADPGKPGTVTVTGVPAGATVTVPATVPGASAVSYANGKIVVTPKPGFSGTIRVPVTMVNGTATVQFTAVVVFAPAPVATVTRTLANGRTVVSWKRSATTSVKQYEVRVNGRKVCVTSSLSCTLPGVLGPKSNVQVIALGSDSSRSTAAVARHRAGGCVTVGTVLFATDSARLTPQAKRELARVAKLIRTQGFTAGCLTGHTDNTGTAAYNMKLSKQRVSSVQGALARALRGVTLMKRWTGEKHPTKSNGSMSGQAANRRVQISVR
jgi:CshA-type fibril repeat protein